MSTRSVIAVKNGTGWQGRYCHSSGYPSYTGAQLFAIVVRDGFEAAVKQLIQEHYGWSCLAASEEAEPEMSGRTGGGFESVAGYGAAYTVGEGQADPADWFTDAEEPDGMEWAYVLDPQGVTVLAAVGDYSTATWVAAGRVEYSTKDGQQAMADIEVLAAHLADWQHHKARQV